MGCFALFFLPSARRHSLGIRACSKDSTKCIVCTPSRQLLGDCPFRLVLLPSARPHSPGIRAFGAFEQLASSSLFTHSRNLLKLIESFPPTLVRRLVFFL